MNSIRAIRTWSLVVIVWDVDRKSNLFYFTFFCHNHFVQPEEEAGWTTDDVK